MTLLDVVVLETQLQQRSQREILLVQLAHQSLYIGCITLSGKRRRYDGHTRSVPKEIAPLI